LRRVDEGCNQRGVLERQFDGSPAGPDREEWLYSEACDGFNIMSPYVPGGLDDFVDRVVPELQRRGLFRREYEGKTLAETSACRASRTASSASRPRS
jgi:hypothetical protein